MTDRILNIALDFKKYKVSLSLVGGVFNNVLHYRKVILSVEVILSLKAKTLNVWWQLRDYNVDAIILPVRRIDRQEV